jgi:aldose 1-epimerase
MSKTEQVLYRSDDIELVMLPGLGARMHSLHVRGINVLRTPSDVTEHERDPFYWGGFVMAPWCNRIAPGPMRVDGLTVDLPVNFNDGTAIHGQVYAAPWERDTDASMAIEREGDGWPWRYRVEMDVAVNGLEVSIVQRLRNLADTPMPAGIGLHPWFPEHVKLAVHSGLVYASNENSSARPVPVDGDLDLRHETEMAVGVDAAWSDPTDPPVELWWPEAGLHAVMRAPFPTLHIVAAYAPERGAIAVEPETHAPQGLRRLVNGEPGALTMIDPGAEIELPISIVFDGGA